MFHNGYHYQKNGITYYKCAKSKDFFCAGTAKKNQDGSIIELKRHSIIHTRNINDEDNMVKIFRNALKLRAKNENLPLKTIYDDEALRHQVAAGLYPWSTAESIMHFSRRFSLPSLPQSLHELSIKFDNGELMRYSCCGSSIFSGCVRDPEGKYGIILACPQLINAVLSHNITEVHADATFKVVPSNMGNQLLSIHCIIDNSSIPIAYALMESKSRNSYQCILDFMKANLFPNLNPSVIVTDYEPALRDSLLSSLGVRGTRVMGCWFHHNQAVWKKMKSLNYLETVNTNQYALKALRMLMCLPLLPGAEIEQGFLLIKAYAKHHNVPMLNLFDYYQSYWIRRVGVNIISVKGVPRWTNNNLESFHNTLRYQFSVTHPNLWVFLGQICSLSLKYHTMVTQLDNGLQPKRNLKTKFIMNSKRIKQATEHHEAGILSIWQFLVKCSYCSATYERRQRNWALGIENSPDEEVAENELNEIPLLNNEMEQSDEHGPNRPNPSVCMTCNIVTAGENVAQYIVLPCGHAWVCTTCVGVLENQTLVRCPMCRGDVNVFQRMFLT